MVPVRVSPTMMIGTSGARLPRGGARPVPLGDPEPVPQRLAHGRVEGGLADGVEPGRAEVGGHDVEAVAERRVAVVGEALGLRDLLERGVDVVHGVPLSRPPPKARGQRTSRVATAHRSPGPLTGTAQRTVIGWPRGGNPQETSTLHAGRRMGASDPHDINTRLIPPADSNVIVLFGATGDLARRKLLPGLFHLFKAGLLPRVPGARRVARRDRRRRVPRLRPRRGHRVRPGQHRPPTSGPTSRSASTTSSQAEGPAGLARTVAAPGGGPGRRRRTASTT